MNSCEKFISELEKRLPELCRPYHLIAMGIFKNRQTIDLVRKQGKGPDFFKIGRKIFYPKEGIIDWFRENMHVTSKEKDKDGEGDESLPS